MLHRPPFTGARMDANGNWQAVQETVADVHREYNLRMVAEGAAPHVPPFETSVRLDLEDLTFPLSNIVPSTMRITERVEDAIKATCTERCGPWIDKDGDPWLAFEDDGDAARFKLAYS